jgi:hypothetical protein
VIGTEKSALPIETGRPPEAQKPASKSERRAERLKLLRPELASQIGKSISTIDAVRIGGYKSQSELTKDLEVREHAMQKLQKTKAK